MRWTFLSFVAYWWRPLLHEMCNASRPRPWSAAGLANGCHRQRSESLNIILKVANIHSDLTHGQLHRWIIIINSHSTYSYIMHHCSKFFTHARDTTNVCAARRSWSWSRVGCSPLSSRLFLKWGYQGSADGWIVFKTLWNLCLENEGCIMCSAHHTVSITL